MSNEQRKKVSAGRNICNCFDARRGLSQSASAIEKYLVRSNIRMEKVKANRGTAKYIGMSRVSEAGIMSTLQFSVVTDGKDVYGSSSCPFAVPVKRRPAVSDLLTRINWHLKHGRFDQNVKDGSVRFRCSLPAAVVVQLNKNGNGLSRVVELPVAMMKDWVGPIRVVSKGKNAESVFKSEIRKFI